MFKGYFEVGEMFCEVVECEVFEEMGVYGWVVEFLGFIEFDFWLCLG